MRDVGVGCCLVSVFFYILPLDGFVCCATNMTMSVSFGSILPSTVSGALGPPRPSFGFVSAPTPCIREDVTCVIRIRKILRVYFPPAAVARGERKSERLATYCRRPEG